MKNTRNLADFCDLVQGGRLKLTGNHFIEAGEYPAFGAGGLNGMLDTYEFEKPAVVLSSIGARCGKCFLPEGRWTSLANTQLIFPDPNQADVKFLWFQLNDESRWHRSGTAQPFIKPSDVKAHRVYLPPLSEQKRIAGILDQADGLRRKRQQALALTDQFLRSTFLDLFGDPRTNSRNWPAEKLGDVLELITYGLTVRPEYVDAGYRLISAREIRQGFVDLASAPFIGEDDFQQLSDKGKPKRGDILFSKTGSIGHCAEVVTDEPFAVSQNAARLRFNESHILSTFALHYLRSAYVQTLANSLAKGNAVRDLQLGDMKTIPIYQPPIATQRKFAEVVRKTESSKNRLGIAAESTSTLFNSLVQRAFRGEL